MFYSCNQDILVWGTNPMRVHWIRDSCLSYFWDRLFLTARPAENCVAMAREAVGQAAQWGREVWLTGQIAVLGNWASEKPGTGLRAQGSWLAKGSCPEAAANSRLCWRWLQTQLYGHTWYILIWKVTTVFIIKFSVLTVHNYGSYFYLTYFSWIVSGISTKCV